MMTTKRKHKPAVKDPLTNETGSLKGLERRTTGNRRKSSRRKADSELTHEPSEAETGITLLENSFALLAGEAEALVARFYEELFKRYPSVQPLFAGLNMADQQKKLLAALKLVVNSLRKPEVLNNALTELGKKHVGYGALPEHYAGQSRSSKICTPSITYHLIFARRTSRFFAGSTSSNFTHVVIGCPPSSSGS